MLETFLKISNGDFYFLGVQLNNTVIHSSDRNKKLKNLLYIHFFISVKRPHSS
jgi:hypothetical protein